MIAATLLALALVGLVTVAKVILGVWDRSVGYHYRKLAGQLGWRGDE